ncbi:hypothetical protein [Nostoc paludosum]
MAFNSNLDGLRIDFCFGWRKYITQVVSSFAAEDVMNRVCNDYFKDAMNRVFNDYSKDAIHRVSTNDN